MSGPTCACRGCAVAFKEGHDQALKAARDAVEDALNEIPLAWAIDPALDAIDALREKP